MSAFAIKRNTHTDLSSNSVGCRAALWFSSPLIYFSVWSFHPSLKSMKYFCTHFGAFAQIWMWHLFLMIASFVCVSSYPYSLSWVLVVYCSTLTHVMLPLVTTLRIKLSESLSTLGEILPMVSNCISVKVGFRLLFALAIYSTVYGFCVCVCFWLKINRHTKNICAVCIFIFLWAIFLCLTTQTLHN